nr:hypothetical protein [Rhodococcus sp. (in: high G+C Gram-positive bacteria)]
MPISLLIARVDPTSAKSTDSFHRWYDDVHIPQVIQHIPGVVAANRYQLADHQLTPAQNLPTHKYLAVYQIDSSDLTATVRRLGEALGDGTLDMDGESISLVGENGPELLFYTPIAQ